MADNDSKVPARQSTTRRLVMKRQQSMSYSTALFYLQSKGEIDDEYRRIVEHMLDGLIRHTGLSGHDIGSIELSSEASPEL